MKLAVYQLFRIFSAFYVHESQPFVPLPGLFNPVHAFPPSYAFKTRLNIPSTASLPSDFFYRGHPVVFNDLHHKRIVYICRQTQQ